MSEWVHAVRRRTAWLDPWYLPLTGVTLAAVAVIAVFRMQTSTADFDPQFMRVVVERTMRFGGGYYENAIHNKGPLEPIVYEAAARLGGRNGFWFVVAVFALCAALCVGAAAAVVGTRAGAGHPVAAAAATAVVVHLTLSESDYAGVLYARNMVVALLAAALVVTELERCWRTERRRRIATIAVGAATGLAVQTLFTACFTATPVLLYAMWTRRRAQVGGRPVWLWLPIASAAAFASAAVWYGVADLVGLREFNDYVDGAWRYARFMSESTGRGPAGQLALAWDRATEYYGDRPLIAAAIGAWLLVAAARLVRADSAERARSALLFAWWLGAWVELAVSQRYSSHYFSVIAVPTLLMAAQLAGWATSRWRVQVAAVPASALLVVVAMVMTVQVGGTRPFGEGIESATTTRSIGALAARADSGRGGRIHFERAVLSGFSRPGDALLAWTGYPWVYLDRQRVSATRFIWKEFLLGEIYLGGRSEDYVLPGTWERWESDLIAANPVAYLVESVNPVESGTPFERVVAERFTTIHSDAEATLALRNDVVTWLVDPPAVGRPGVAIAAGELLAAGCARVDGILGAGTTTFTVGTRAEEPATITVQLDESGDGLVDSNRHGVAGYQVPVVAPPTTFTLVAGRRATLLVIGGQVVGAVERGGATVSVSGDGAARVLAGEYTVSAAHPLSGC